MKILFYSRAFLPHIGGLEFLVAILAPRISRYLERGGDVPLRGGQRAAGKAPGPREYRFQGPHRL